MGDPITKTLAHLSCQFSVVGCQSETRFSRSLPLYFSRSNGLSTFSLRGTQSDDLLPGLRVTGFERHVKIAFIVTADAVLIEGIFYGGRDFEAEIRDRA